MGTLQVQLQAVFSSTKALQAATSKLCCAKICQSLCVFVLVAIVAPGCGPHGAPSQPTQSSALQLEERVHELINAERSSRRLAPLERRTALDAIARQHSERMANQRISFGHKGAKDRAAQVRAALNTRAVAENVAQNQGFSDPVTTAVKSWMDSRGHRRNLLNTAFAMTGIGIATADDGKVYFTQLFTTAQ